jgi:hypothetical protein
MKKSKFFQTDFRPIIKVYAAMFVMVLVGYSIFHNRAFSGNEFRGTLIWLSASTVKFVNSWLKENPFNLRFLMMEWPASIEFNDINARIPYISYPPGAILPPYLLAKIMHKSEIQLTFIKQFLQLKFFVDTLLVCFIIFGILTHCLKSTRIKWAALTSVVVALTWMLLPPVSYYMRNVYFADQCVITVVLLFTWLEIYDDHFSGKRFLAKFPYFTLKFLVSFYGILTDYYFWFVIFVAWLVKIIPLFNKGRKATLKSMVVDSVVYVAPVLLGITLFVFQLSTIPNVVLRMYALLKFRTFDGWHPEGVHNLILICQMFFRNYMLSYKFIIAFVILFIGFIIKNKKPNRNIFDSFKPLIKIGVIINIAPCLQVLFLQNHSAIHEFSILKFGLPIVFTSFIAITCIFISLNSQNSNLIVDYEKNNRGLMLKLPVWHLTVILSFIMIVAFTNIRAELNSYYSFHIGEVENFEKEHLIGDNYDYNDIYFSFTESISADPADYINIAVSRKLIYTVNQTTDIQDLFPNLNKNARILFVINKNNVNKTESILKTENDIIGNSPPLFESQNYGIYEYHE